MCGGAASRRPVVNPLLCLAGAEGYRAKRPSRYAVNAVTFSVFVNSGQICMSADRILVHESLAEEFTQKFMTKVASLQAGDPMHPHTVVGPLVTASAADRMAELVKDAVAKGATVLAGGGQPDGALHPATVLIGIPSDADLYYAEAFGPVCVVEAFTDDETAIVIANDAENG